MIGAGAAALTLAAAVISGVTRGVSLHDAPRRRTGKSHMAWRGGITMEGQRPRSNVHSCYMVQPRAHPHDASVALFRRTSATNALSQVVSAVALHTSQKDAGGKSAVTSRTTTPRCDGS